MFPSRLESVADKGCSVIVYWIFNSTETKKDFTKEFWENLAIVKSLPWFLKDSVLQVFYTPCSTQLPMQYEVHALSLPHSCIHYTNKTKQKSLLWNVGGTFYSTQKIMLKGWSVLKKKRKAFGLRTLFMMLDGRQGNRLLLLYDASN